MSFKAVLEFHNQAIDKMLMQVEQQKILLALVKNVLPENLAKHTLYCVIHDTTLLIYTDLAVWSSQLRFYETTILAAVGQSIKRIQVRLLMKNVPNDNRSHLKK
jgi:hypothetical protein